MLTALVLLPALTLGEQPAASTPAAELPPAPTYETAVLGGLGLIGGEETGGPALSLSIQHRLGFAKLGVELSAATAFFGAQMGGLGGLAGFHFGSDFSVSILGAAGLHGYEAVGRRLLSADPGVDGSSPYVGGRLLLGYSFGSHLFLGVVGMLDEDLDRQSKSVSYQQTSWFDGEPSEQTSRHTIGQTTWGTLLVVGREFDLARY